MSRNFGLVPRNLIPSAADAPFHCPPDIVLDLPAPPSVNKTRRVDWAGKSKLLLWKKSADVLVHVAKARKPSLPLNKMPRFELAIVMSETHTNIDLDNGLKNIIDYLRRIGLIENDAKENMRALTVTWGSSEDAPHGCRVFVRPCA